MATNTEPDKLAGTRWLVMGAGRSGRGAVRLLRAAGTKARWADEKILPPNLADETRTGAWHEEWLDGVDGVVWSPGIPLWHPLAVEAKRRGLQVISEIELAYRFARSPIVAITGSNGKTTTTRWIALMLQAEGLHAVDSGNIGHAFTEVIANELEGQARAEAHVVEVSSYQLESIDRFRPGVAVILNVTPNHLDHYPDMDVYIEAKERLVRNMRRGQTLVVNGEDERCRAIASRAACEAVFFGRASRLSRGALLDGDRLVWRRSESDETHWVDAGELKVPGAHNVQNALAAAVAARLMGAGDEAIRQALRDFPGVEHRIEFVAEIDGVRYFNDSKSTTVESLEVALKSFSQPVALIAGGRDKKADFAQAGALVRERVRHAILIGEAAGRIASQWQGLTPVTILDGMPEAVARAREIAVAGDVALLSPACASFDQYSDFEERGREFKRLVLEMSKEKRP